MADEDKSSKTEKPTGKKLNDAKKQGQNAQSQELQSWAVLMGVTFVLLVLAPWSMTSISMINIKFIQQPHAIPVDLLHLREVMMQLVQEVGMIVLPIMVLFLVIGVSIMIGQIGWTISTEKIKLEISKFSPAKGIKKMVSVRQVVEFAKSLVKFAIVASVLLTIVVPMLADIQLFPGFDIIEALGRIHEIATIIVAAVVLIMTIVAAADFAYQKYDHTKKLMMSKQEVKDERKQSDGDPMVKQRIAKLRIERQQQRMLAAMGKADVVITNPTHYAIALQYNMETMPAPVLIAKGVDEVAARIREAAEEFDVPIVENPPLARALFSAVDIDQEIPAEHYHAVAEIIGYVYRIKGKLPQAPVQPSAGTGNPDTSSPGATSDEESQSGPVLN
ncbi:MAG: flagellar biosynthesis protein FlhB [Rhodospirillaceae bacterium]|jgi:flagellar biosynthetic protein FlhB|nr:flagellar biosynthesis protein FlhB [Rhodospirillaceae bacterium]|tara:strand:- start:636 stop:1802 length:1167 start_codon:yes stop_codon:yes gene_type:complete